MTDENLKQRDRNIKGRRKTFLEDDQKEWCQKKVNATDNLPTSGASATVLNDESNMLLESHSR
ncbi:hypothetical protein J1614_003402 [Plenodomus biglobosus]|nr:hypothetical protein J1614_003402 [Plenodomus biglobosus]